MHLKEVNIVPNFCLVWAAVSDNPERHRVSTPVYYPYLRITRVPQPLVNCSPRRRSALDLPAIAQTHPE